MSEAFYSGKAKTLYRATEPGYLVMDFRDDVTAFNGEKHATLQCKGELNCAINTLVMEYLESQGIATHFVRQLDAHSTLVKAARVLPVECIFRNRVAGSFMKKYGLGLGDELAHPVYEYCVKSDALGDPLIAPGAITALGMLTPEQLEWTGQETARINRVLGELFADCDYQLVDGKLEFGLLEESGELALVDEFTPDSCRLWSAQGERFDKDLFREDLGDLVGGYREVHRRLCSALRQPVEP